MNIKIRKSCLPNMTVLVLLLTQSCQRKSPGRESQPPGRANESTVDSSSPATAADNQSRIGREGMILINGGHFLMGTQDGMSYEAPVHEVTIKSFWMDSH